MTTDRNFDSTAYGRGYKDGKRDAAEEIARLRERLEVDPSHPYDGIYCRDETIRGQEAQIASLKAEVERLRAALEGISCMSVIAFHQVRDDMWPHQIVARAALTTQEKANG